MPGSDSQAPLDRQIAVVTDLIGQYRRMTKRLKADGRNADGAQFALNSLEQVFRQRLVERLDLENAEWSTRRRRG